MKKFYLSGSLIFITLILCAFPGSAQQGGSIFGELLLSKWIKNEPISTSFRDAVKQSELQDNFGNGKKFKALHRQPRSVTGAFILKPDFYEMKARSYCLRAGTHGPSSGDGYLYAPLLGRQEDIVREVLTRSEAHSEINQKEVQTLLWAIIARCDFRSMNLQMIDAARKLMKPAHIARLNKRMFMDFALNTINSPQLTASLMNVLQSENQLRNLIGQSSATFQDLEQLAMLVGPARIDNPEYRQGRWSKHPDGYFVRYYPQSYSHTIIQVYVPESVATVEFDATNDVAVPANTGAQRLALSNVPYDTSGYEREIPPVIAQAPPIEVPSTSPEVQPQKGNSKSSPPIVTPPNSTVSVSKPTTPPTTTASVPKPTTPPTTTASVSKPTTPPASTASVPKVTTPPAPLPVPAPAMRSLCGKVIDAKTGKIIAGATITTKGQSYTADAQGQFNMPDLRPDQKFILATSAQAYENLTQDVQIEAGKDCQPVTIILMPMSKPQSSTAIVLEGTTIREGERFIIDNIHFEQSKSELLPEGKAELDKVASWMKNHESIKIELSGHTTNEGEHELNVDLSKRRAIACKKYLMEKGVKSKRISTDGYGPDRPVVPQESAEKAQNRRVEMKIIQA